MKRLLSFLLVIIAAGDCNLLKSSTALGATATPQVSITPASATTSAILTDAEPAFPRLGMWWPDTENQSTADIARYDWVILGKWQSDAIDGIRAINPDIRLLNSTNACELDFDPDDSSSFTEIQKIPYQWFLTQVGSTLRESINATQTNIPVQEVTKTGTDGTVDLFIAGDTVLIEGESMLVQSVDTANRTLTVERGYVRPASVHTAGTRIAAHISFWPNSWMLNLSTLSPIGTADSAYGAERWSDYNAREAASLLSDSRWSGILVDRSDPDESWLIDNSTARTIDPDQSNTLLSDYSAFDEAWNSGLRSFLDQLRAQIGTSKIIYLNWGIPYYTAVNGNNFEGFPGDDGLENWHSLVFGAYDNGSYFDWIEQSGQPNLTMIETYEDNSSPDPDDADGYANTCDDAGFIPNYRKMRFGLATALLNDGYYSYEMNTEGHGSLCLMWFDEYDNAGAGQGYLGYPQGDAYQVANDGLGTNLLPAISFDGDGEITNWDAWADEPDYQMTVSADGSAVLINVEKAAGVDWQAALSYSPVPITQDAEYTLSFTARADKSRTITAWVQQNEDPWENYIWFDEFELSTEWQDFEIPAAATGTDTAAQFSLGFGTSTGKVWIENVTLRKGNTDVWRRDYDHGIVLINATSQAVTVPLDGRFVKINGTQDRTVNDGSTVTEVTLASQDGIVLLRSSAAYYFLPDIHMGIQ